MLIALPDGRASHKVVNALAEHITTLPDQLQRPLTWDQGTEAWLTQRTDIGQYALDAGPVNRHCTVSVFR